MKKETRVYVVPDVLATDLCKAMGLDPMRVSRMKFEFEAQTGQPLTIELDYLPDYTPLAGKDYQIKRFSVEEIESMDDLEAGYHASET